MASRAEPKKVLSRTYTTKLKIEGQTWQVASKGWNASLMFLKTYPISTLDNVDFDFTIKIDYQRLEADDGSYLIRTKVISPFDVVQDNSAIVLISEENKCDPIVLKDAHEVVQDLPPTTYHVHGYLKLEFTIQPNELVSLEIIRELGLPDYEDNLEKNFKIVTESGRKYEFSEVLLRRASIVFDAMFAHNWDEV